jgi:cytochrome c oxidase subunit 4
MTEQAQEQVTHPRVGHVVSPRILLGIWAALIVLTVLTVLATRVDFGASANLWVAMGIATVKAGLVVLYFMHLRYDSPVYAMVLIFTLFFVALFIAGTLTDAAQYQNELQPGYAPAMQKR